jgi:hypothetical protein
VSQQEDDFGSGGCFWVVIFLVAFIGLALTVKLH